MHIFPSLAPRSTLLCEKPRSGRQRPGELSPRFADASTCHAVPRVQRQAVRDVSDRHTRMASSGLTPRASSPTVSEDSPEPCPPRVCPPLPRLPLWPGQSCGSLQIQDLREPGPTSASTGEALAQPRSGAGPQPVSRPQAGAAAQAWGEPELGLSWIGL